MIRFFPEIYPDEILYSVFARYHKMSKNNSATETMYELFGGDKNSIASLYYYYHLNILCERLPEELKYSTEYLILNHTVTPFFFPFMSEERYTRIMNSIKGDCMLLRLSGIVSEGIFPTNIIKVCPKCYDEDLVKYKEAYLHRRHQMPGNFVCNKHEQLLHEYIIPDNQKREYVDIMNVEFSIPKLYLNSELMNYTKHLHSLFEGVLNNLSFKDICIAYRNELHRQGYYLRTQLLNQRKIKEKFKEYYSEKFLSILNSNLPNYDSMNWINNITSLKSKGYIHPTRHLLFINFLFGGINNLMDTINRGNNNEIFLKRKLESKLAEKHILWREWDNRLKIAIEGGITNISELCRLMKSCRRTIIYHAKHLGLIDKLKTKSKLKEYNSKPKYQYNINALKQNLLDYLKNNPQTEQRIIRKAMGNDLVILRKLDPNWVANVLPARKRNFQSQIDWDKRDKEYSKLIVDEIHRILMQETPIRVMKHIVCNNIGIYNIVSKYRSKLPLTISAINNGIESYSMFMNRKIRYELCKLKACNADLLDKKIIRKHFRNIYNRKFSNFGNIIDKIIEEINSDEK